jgi:hypothetical protein
MNANNEHLFIAGMFFSMPIVAVFLMSAWDVYCQMRRERKRGSYYRHPSQGKDLYHNHNRGTVQK